MPTPLAVRRPRLATLNNASGTSITYQSSSRRSPSSGPTPPTTVRPKEKCCDDPSISADLESGSTLCYNCGRVFQESEIVAEITFGENSAGAAVVQGGFVGGDQRHANTMGGTMHGLPGMESREKTLWKGRDEITKLIVALHLRQTISDMAVGLYRLALGMNFVQGRRIRNVAACCIYLADRKQKESSLLLMDLCEKIQVNVWTLGDTYKQFLAAVMEVDPASAPEGKDTVPQLEPLVLKFCRRLEFGLDAHRVAEDACDIMKGMRRDWMVDGRQPAGIIGAAIILAARMNNFRRTVREVVYCVRVADSTINQRLYEFKRTKRSTLTVDQFRKFGPRLKDDMQPPSVWRRQEKEEKKRKRALIAVGLGDDDEDVTEDAEVVTTSTSPAAKKRKTKKGPQLPTPANTQVDSTPANTQEVDSNGFLIPDIPINPNASEQDTLDFESTNHLEYVAAATAPESLVDSEAIVPAPKKRGRPPKKRAPRFIPDEDLEIEEEIEDEVLQNLEAMKNAPQWENVFKEFNTNEKHPILLAAGEKAQDLARRYMPNANIPDTETVFEDEFEDDDDVRTCVNTPQEIAIKEKLWITENEEWLRDQQAKLLAKELEDASGKPKKVKKQRKRTVMGDGSVLDGKPAASTREAVQKMMDKRAKHFSNNINYEMLKELFPDEQDAAKEKEKEKETEKAKEKPKQAAQTGTETVEIVDGDAEGGYEEYEQTYVEDEPVDDLHQYMSDDEYGFEDIQDDF